MQTSARVTPRPSGAPTLPVGQGQAGRVDLQHGRRHRQDLVLDLPGGLLHGPARHVGGRGGVGALVEGGEVGVRGVDHDLVQADPEDLGGDLAQDGVRAGADVGGPYQQVERAVVVHLDGGRRHVDQGDARPLHVQRHAHPAPDGPGVRGPGALSFPAERLHAGPQAFLGGARLDGHRHTLAAFPELREDRGGLAAADVVAEPQLDRVEPEPGGHLVERGLQGEGALGAAVAPVRPAHRQGGVHRPAGEAHVGGLVVQGQGLRPGVGEHGEAVGAVGPGVLGGVHLQGVEGAVGAGPDLHADAERVAGAGGNELLFAGVLPAGGAPGAHGYQGADVLEQDLLLDAEAAADARLDHPDAADGEVEQLGR